MVIGKLHLQTPCLTDSQEHLVAPDITEYLKMAFQSRENSCISFSYKTSAYDKIIALIP